MKNNAGLGKTTLRDLPENTAGLLCYVGTWITGIIFLVLYPQNRYVRFHAFQSIIVFGSLILAGIVLGNIPYAGPPLDWIITALGFALWIVLIIKASSGEIFKMPWAGALAEKLAADSTLQSTSSATGKSEPAETPDPAEPASRPITPSRGEIFRTRYYSFGHRAGRVTASAFAIAWSIAILIFFNFYNQYLAYYARTDTASGSHWQMYTLVTSDINSWLPILNITLTLAILGHILMIVFDKYIIRQITRIVLSMFGIATVVTLLAIFPFNFDVIPNPDASFWAPTGLTVLLLAIAVGFGIGALVRFIKLIVNLAEGKY